MGGHDIATVANLAVTSFENASVSSATTSKTLFLSSISSDVVPIVSLTVVAKLSDFGL
jgi:hypothetical protein